MGFFYPKQKMYVLKFTVELFAMTVKNDAKIEEESMTCQSKTDMRNLTNFDRSI